MDHEYYMQNNYCDCLRYLLGPKSGIDPHLALDAFGLSHISRSPSGSGANAMFRVDGKVVDVSPDDPLQYLTKL